MAWDADAACQHHWTGQNSRYTGKRKGQHIGAEAAERGVKVRDTSPDACGHPVADTGDSCENCGAWRGHLGLEPRFEMYVEHLVSVFDEVRRVLRSDGVLFLNLGDCYHNGDKGGYSGARIVRDCLQRGNSGADFVGAPNRQPQPSLKAKDLVGIPWRVALALQSQGWWLRSDIIWAKPNPMPESVRDRPTRSHEYLFLLTKSERYFYDHEAIKEPSVDAESQRPRSPRSANQPKSPKYFDPRFRTRINDSANGKVYPRRNARSVWTIPTQPFRGAHFATFPERLAERCIRAGTSEAGCCTTCGRPWRRITEKRAADMTWLRQCGADSHGGYRGGAVKNYSAAGGQDPSAVKERILRGLGTMETVGWSPSCRCAAGQPIPCTVLDPFAGSGTTGLVAARLGREFVGIELNPEYATMAQRRLNT